MTTSTGPSTRTGPPGTIRTPEAGSGGLAPTALAPGAGLGGPGGPARGPPVRGAGGVADAVGADHAQVLARLARPQQAPGPRLGGAGPHHRAERLAPPR